MKILVINFPGVGSSSISAAIDKLGFSTYEFVDHVTKSSRFWNRFYGGKIEMEEFETYYNSAEAVVDIPTSAHWMDILKLYNKKLRVILLLPDSETLWLKSWKTEARNFRKNLQLAMALSLTPTGRSINRTLNESCEVSLSLLQLYVINDVLDIKITGVHYWSRALTEEKLMQSYKGFIKDIKKHVPKDQLLIYRISEEWKPLCEFLDVEKPPIEFPYRTQNFSTNLVFPENPLRLNMLIELCYVLAFAIFILSAIFYLVFGDFEFTDLFKPKT